MLSRNFSNGFGPEEYLIRTGEKGAYQINADLFSNVQNPQPVTCKLRIITNQGKPEKEEEWCTVFRLEKMKKKIPIAVVLLR